MIIIIKLHSMWSKLLVDRKLCKPEKKKKNNFLELIGILGQKVEILRPWESNEVVWNEANICRDFSQ